MSKRTVVLIVLDGWGIGYDNFTNPIYIANLENINHIKSNYLTGSLQASGIAVGLPWGEEGNSETGHLTIGAGKVIYQHFPRITLSIRDGSFFQNKVLLEALNHAVKNQSAVNLVGVLAEGNIHSSLEHLLTLIEFSQKIGAKKINLHLFSDDKDSAPKSILKLLEIISDKQAKLATLSGKYYAMDRDHHWERTNQAYDALLGKGTPVADIKEHINNQYKRDLTDEYLEPTIVGPEINSIKDNDSVIFFNYREDSIRQIVSPFALKDFKEFPITPLKNIYLATMTQYSDKFDANVMFPPEKIENSLGVVLAENNKLQLRIAETEKYAHVTYFFNGLKDVLLKNEYRILVPSRNLARHDEHPEMMAEEVSNRVMQAIEDGDIDFILANFANADIIAHTGNFDATVKAVKVIDLEIGKIIKTALARDGIVMITSDHGNAEQMISPLTGLPETKHDPNLVPVYLVGKEFVKIKNKSEISRIENEAVGILSDIAPTVLELLKIAKPAEMSGESLIGRLE